MKEFLIWVISLILIFHSFYYEKKNAGDLANASLSSKESFSFHF